MEFQEVGERMTFTTRHTPKGWAVIAPDGTTYAYRASEWAVVRYAEKLNTKREKPHD